VQDRGEQVDRLVVGRGGAAAVTARGEPLPGELVEQFSELVVIAGAGPTGLTLAIDLARRGVAVRIVDRAATPFVGSRGEGLHPAPSRCSTHATTLGFGVAAGHPIRRPEGPEIPGALVDVEGHAFAAYCALPGTVVEIRPDGYVAEIRAAS
jgi:FAD binding domain